MERLPHTNFAIRKLKTPDAKDLFTGLLQRDEFEFGLGKLVDYLRLPLQDSFREERSFAKPEDRVELLALRRRLAGYLFKWMAYDFLTGQLEENLRLLSPRQTDALYRYRFRDMRYKFNEHGGFELGISGITIPNGVILDINPSSEHWRLSVNSFCAYMLSPLDLRTLQAQFYTSPDRMLHQLISPRAPSRRQSEFNEKLRSLLGIRQKTRFVQERYYEGATFVLPDSNEEGYREYVEGTLTGAKEVKYVPFTSGEFGGILTSIIDDTAEAVGVKVPHQLKLRI